MAFSEADLIVQIKAASAKTYTAWNMSLGAYACPGDAAFLPVLDLLASVHAAQPDLWIFAAAGNSGALQPHFPAALRHPDTVNSWDIKNPKARNKAQAASKALADVLHGVGSVEVDKNDTPTAKSAFSSCGTWIDSEEPGSSQIATYPAAPGKTAAQWSGTSFATARATARFLVATATGNGDKLQVADPKLFSNC